jgi:predicted acetyltransferase
VIHTGDPNGDMVNLRLIDVREADKAVLANLIQLYRYDLSEFRGYELSPHGTYAYRYLDHYFLDQDRRASFIEVDSHLAGFCLTRRLEPDLCSMAEFFVVRAHRHRGIAQAAATSAFTSNPGRWQVAVDHHNTPALTFWKKLIEAVATTNVSHSDRFPPDVAFPGRWFEFEVANTSHPR